jgi:hypothetical protein
MTPDELRKLFDTWRNTNGWTLADVDFYVKAAADAWEADHKLALDYPVQLAELISLRKRLEEYKTALESIADYRDNDATIRALRIARAALAGEKNYMDKYPGGYKEWEDLHGRQEP